MTPDEHASELRRLEKRRAEKREASKGPGKTLAEKLELIREMKDVDTQIYQHKLNYHDLVSRS